MARTTLFATPDAISFDRIAAPLIAGTCFVVGLFIGAPTAGLALGWVREQMIPAFMELYASGIPFCG